MQQRDNKGQVIDLITIVIATDHSLVNCLVKKRSTVHQGGGSWYFRHWPICYPGDALLSWVNVVWKCNGAEVANTIRIIEKYSIGSKIFEQLINTSEMLFPHY